MADPVLQLVWPVPGRYGPLSAAGEGPHRLWSYRGRPPQTPYSVLLTQGQPPVVKPHPTLDEVAAADVCLVGGKDYRFTATDWEYAALVAFGYEFVEVTP